MTPAKLYRKKYYWDMSEVHLNGTRIFFYCLVTLVCGLWLNKSIKKVRLFFLQPWFCNIPVWHVRIGVFSGRNLSGTSDILGIIPPPAHPPIHPSV